MRFFFSLLLVVSVCVLFFLPPLLLPLDGWLLGENRIVVFPVFTFYSSIVSLFFSPFKRLPQRRTHVERRRWYMATVFVFFFFFFKCVTNGPLNRRNGERWQERRFGPAVRKRAQDGRRRLYCFLFLSLHLIPIGRSITNDVEISRLHCGMFSQEHGMK